MAVTVDDDALDEILELLANELPHGACASCGMALSKEDGGKRPYLWCEECGEMFDVEEKMTPCGYCGTLLERKPGRGYVECTPCQVKTKIVEERKQKPPAPKAEKKTTISDLRARFSAPKPPRGRSD